MCAAARIGEGTLPSGRGGVASTTSATLATRAGIAVISTVDGYAARPPGAYTPARLTGRVTSFRPGNPTEPGSDWRSWKSRMRRAANSSAKRSAGAKRSAAAASSCCGTSNDSPGAGAHPSKRRPSSRSASLPSASTRAQISVTASRSLANWVRSSLRRDRGESSHEPTSNLLTGMTRCLAQLGDHRLHRCRARLEARLVGDQPRGRAAEHRRDAQAVVSQGPPRRGQIDDAIDQADLRRQLDRSVEEHYLDRLPARLEPSRSGARVLRGHPNHRRPGLGAVEARCIRHGQHEPAAAETQVDELVVSAGRLPQDVLPDDAQVRRAVVDVGGHVTWPDEDHPQTFPLDQQLPPQLFGSEPRDSGTREQRESALVQRAGRDCDRDLVGGRHVTPPARRAATCSGGRRRVRCPCADHATVESFRQWTRLAAPTARHQAFASDVLLDSVSTTARMPNRRRVEPNRSAVLSPAPLHAKAASRRGNAGGRGVRVSISETRSSWTMKPVAGAGRPKRSSKPS